MATEIYMCTGCYQTPGQDDGNDYCAICGSHKYFAWVEGEEDV
jgi:rRNA maturation endonuclease Nob1